MRVKFEAVFKIYVICLVALLVWTMWAAASEPTNEVPKATSPAAERVNVLGGLISTNAPLDFGLSKVKALQPPFMGVPRWQYVASLIYIVLAFLVARLLDWFIRSKLRHWAAKTRTQLDDIFIQLLGGPIKVIVFVILLQVGLQLFPWPEAVENYITKGLRIIIAISLTYVALRVIDVLIDYWRQRAAASQDRGMNDHLLPFVRNTLKVFIAIVAVLLTCESLGFPMKGLLASLSVGGLAVGLAAQDTLANLFGAVAVFVDKPFRVGDRIKLDATEGEVESIGMRSTRVRTADGHLVAIPNKTVGNATITNIARRTSIRTVMNIGVTYDTSAERVKRAVTLLEEIYKAHPMTKDVVITFNKFADSALNIEVVHLWNSTDYKAYLKGLQDLNLTVKERFDAERIEFAFPSQTVYVKSVDAGS
jgi:MscS family membrane protein